MERKGNTRLDIKKYARTALIAATLAGCGGGVHAEPQKTTVPSPSVSPTETTLPISTPNPKPTEIVMETPAPTETPELSLDQQASNAVLDYWFGLLTSTQKIDKNNYKNYLQVSIQNFDDWKQNIDTLKYSGYANSDLIVDWVGGKITPNANLQENITGYEGTKSQGEMILQGISSHSESDSVSNADKTKGINWSGRVVINFDFSQTENRYIPIADDPYVKLQRVTDWILKPGEEPLSTQFSPSENFTFVIPTVNENGKWKIYKNNFNVDESMDDIIHQVVQPIPYLGDSRICDGRYYYVCQQFEALY